MTLSAVLHTMLLPWLAGLVFGFCAGVPAGIIATLRWIDRRRTQGKPMPTYTDEDFPDAGHRPWHGGREHLSRFGIALALLGVLAFLAAVISIVQSNSTANCLADFNSSFTQAQRERADAAELDRQAIRQQRQVTREFNQLMIDAVTDPAVDPAQQETARQDFLAKARDWDARLAEVDRLDQQAQRQREASPLPDRPAC